MQSVVVLDYAYSAAPQSDGCDGCAFAGQNCLWPYGLLALVERSLGTECVRDMVIYVKEGVQNAEL
jgi:hypothetical protein